MLLSERRKERDCRNRVRPGKQLGLRAIHMRDGATVHYQDLGMHRADPKLVSASTRIFELARFLRSSPPGGFPAIGAGVPLSELRYDVVGSLYAATPTIGAYEFSPGTPGPSGGISACDINGDGAVNSTDVQLASCRRSEQPPADCGCAKERTVRCRGCPAGNQRCFRQRVYRRTVNTD